MKNKRKPIRKLINKVFDAADKITSTIGSAFIQVSMTASNVQTLYVNPSYSYFGTRANYFSDIFNQFRFKKLDIVIPPQGKDVMIAYDSIPNTTATSAAFADLSQLSNFQFLAAAKVSDAHFKIGKKGLLNNQSTKWWNCRTITTDAQLDSQGFIELVSSSTFTLFLELRYEIEFVHPEPPADYVSSVLKPGVIIGFAKSTALLDDAKSDDDDWHALPPPTPVGRSIPANCPALGRVNTVRRS